MLRKISELFGNDAFIPTASVFPELDKDRLAYELDLEKKGTERGGNCQPASDTKTLDHVELDAASKVEALRRRGLQNYETNRQVYSERLNQAGAARMQVETEANDAKSRFVEETVRWRSLMVEPRERVQEAYEWRNEFRKSHGLKRPAKKAATLVSIIGLGFVMVMLESAGNAYLFAQKNPLGLLGGLMAAFLVSVGNVAGSTLFGLGTRFINVRGFQRLLIKAFGAALFLAWLFAASGYNLAVAHFRDAAETVDAWRDAGALAIETLIARPLSLHTMESYVLLILGIFISIISFLKGYHSSDPYPGYSKVQADLTSARDNYIDHLEDAIEKLAEYRDNAVETLRAAYDEVQRNITDSIDALYGQRTLASGLAPFLEQCDIAANYLLAIYRDANRAARPDDKSEVPNHFSEQYKFAPFTPPDVEDVRRKDAEDRVKEIEDLVSAAIKQIFEVFENAIHDHYEIDELEGVYSDRARVLASSRKGRSDASDLQVISGKKASA